jgi:hypothetical protein
MNADPSTPADQPPTLKKDGRYYAGMSALALSVVLPLLGLCVPLLGLPVGISAVLIGGMVAGGPEVLILLAAALLGKDTLHYYLGKFKRTLRDAVIVKPVSKVRYYIGLTIFLVSVVPFYLYGYFPEIMPPGDTRIYIVAGSDLSFIFSVFLMGGEFWDKLRRLFVWEGTA